MAMEKNSLHKLLVESLQDIYDAEHQLLEALPKMEEAATSQQLKSGLKSHLTQTQRQAERLERVFEALNEKARRKPCVGMQGIIKEGDKHIQELKNDKSVLDAGIIAAAQKVEHYEIAAYGTVKAYAKMLGQENVVKYLDQTLQEEFDTDSKLTELAEMHINEKAMK